MDILIASSPHADTFGYSMPPPGMLRLGGELRQAGLTVGLDDLAYRMASGDIAQGDGLCRDAAQWLAERGDFNVLGLSTMGATLPAAVAIAEHFRTLRPDTPILIGGPGTTGTDQMLLERFPWIDAVVRGEGEHTLIEWLARRKADPTANWAGIDGVTWRAGNQIKRESDRQARKDMERVADYAWDLLPPLTAYKELTGEPEGLTPLDSGRGCAFDCSFCTIGRYWQRRSRPLPVPRLASEILSLQDMAGAAQAYLCHDLFGADRAHALALCEALIAEGAPVPFEVRARLDHLDRELLQKMADAGCYRVLLGIESAAPAVRAQNQKNMRADIDPMAVIDDCEAAGIVPILSLILGLPGEGPEELEQTLELCFEASLRRGVHISLHLVNPQPGCQLGEEFGAQSQPVENIPPDMALGCGHSAEEASLIAQHPDLFCSFHLLPASSFPGGLAELHGLAAISRELPELLRRYPRTMNLLRRVRGFSARQVWDRFIASGLSFTGWVRSMREERLSACLQWEQTSVRIAAAALRPSGASHNPDPAPELAPESGPGEVPNRPGPEAGGSDWIPRVAGETLLSPLPLDELAQSLRSGTPLPGLGKPAPYAVVAGPGLFGSVRTLRISPDTKKVLDWVEESPRPPSQIPPALRSALSSLQKAGLVLSAPAP